MQIRGFPGEGASDDSRVIKNVDFQGFWTLCTVFGTLVYDANIII